MEIEEEEKNSNSTKFLPNIHFNSPKITYNKEVLNLIIQNLIQNYSLKIIVDKIFYFCHSLDNSSNIDYSKLPEPDSIIYQLLQEEVGSVELLKSLIFLNETINNDNIKLIKDKKRSYEIKTIQLDSTSAEENYPEKDNYEKNIDKKNNSENNKMNAIELNEDDETSCKSNNKKFYKNFKYEENYLKEEQRDNNYINNNNYNIINNNNELVETITESEEGSDDIISEYIDLNGPFKELKENNKIKIISSAQKQSLTKKLMDEMNIIEDEDNSEKINKSEYNDIQIIENINGTKNNIERKEENLNKKRIYKLKDLSYHCSLIKGIYYKYRLHKIVSAKIIIFHCVNAGCDAWGIYDKTDKTFTLQQYHMVGDSVVCYHNNMKKQDKNNYLYMKENKIDEIQMYKDILWNSDIKKETKCFFL